MDNRKESDFARSFWRRVAARHRGSFWTKVKLIALLAVACSVIIPVEPALAATCTYADSDPAHGSSVSVSSDKGLAWLQGVTLISVDPISGSPHEEPFHWHDGTVVVPSDAHGGLILRGKLYMCSAASRTSPYTAALAFTMLAPEAVINTNWVTEDRTTVLFMPEDTRATPVTAPWEDGPYPPEDLTALAYADSTMHWYQEAPEELGVFLIIPRVYKGDCIPTVGNDTDRCVLWRGRRIRFCVTDDPTQVWPNVNRPCPKSGTGTEDPSEPTGAGTFAGSDTLDPGIAPLRCSRETHHWQGAMHGLLAPDTDSDPLEAFSGEFQLDAYVECEDLSAGTGYVEGFTVASTELQFQFLSSLAFIRVGYAVTTEVFGVCTSGARPYVCVITLTGVWTPEPPNVMFATLTSGVVAINYDSDFDTWEE